MGDQRTDSVACFFVDQAGDYKVKLTVTDSEMCEATDTLTLRAVPAAAIHVEMTWPVDADIDLHMTEPNGIFGCWDGEAGMGSAQSDSDCAYCNCRGADSDMDGVPDFSPTLDWGPNGMGDGVLQNNPGLDIDRICVGDSGGFGGPAPPAASEGLVPENIILGTQDFPPTNGKYHVGAHYYGNCAGAGAVDVTIRIFISGVLKFESTRTLNEPGNVWHVARIDWNNGGATICELDRFFNRPPYPLPAHPADDADTICQNQ